jgi:hypothetical protein
VPYTVGIYSPGKAFVVYDMRRHVYGGIQRMSFAQATLEQYSNLSDSAISSHYTLDEHHSQHDRFLHGNTLL